MLLNKFYRRCLYALCIVLAPSFAVSQQNGSRQAEGDFNLDLTKVLQGVYFQDPLGIQLANRSIPLEGVIDPLTYVLGSNDLISVELDGAQKIMMRGVLVNPQGDVVLPSIGAVHVANLTIPKAEEKIKEQADKVFNNSSIKISVESPRPVIIHITGGVPFPGKYLALPQSRVDQAIYQSVTSGNRDLTKSVNNSSSFLGSPEYSYRDILIERMDGSVIEADLVTYFRTGDFSSNPYVKDGDLITIRKLSREAPKISISGAVKYEFETEYKKSDTPKGLLNIAGGFIEEADQSKLLVFRRSVSGVERIEIEPENWDSFELLPNDRVVASLNRGVDKSASAWVYGEVETPGNFPIVSGETSALELLELTGGVTKNALQSAAYLTRNSDQKNSIPNDFNTDLLKRTSDQFLQGLEYLDAETKISQNKVFIDLDDRAQLESLKLFDGDRLYIPRDPQTVFVFGQVNNPGLFPFTPNSNIPVEEYISKAGGFALSADKDRVFVIKAGNSTWFNPSDTELESGDKIFVDRLPVEELNALRAYEIQRQQLRNQRTQLILTAITTITGIITTYLAIENFRRQ